MINIKIEDGIFNFRVAGILINNNKVLVHRLINRNTSKVYSILFRHVPK